MFQATKQDKYQSCKGTYTRKTQQSYVNAEKKKKHYRGISRSIYLVSFGICGGKSDTGGDIKHPLLFAIKKK